MKTKIFLIFLLITLFSYPAIKSFLPSGLFETHDGKFHILRIHFMHQELKKGQFPVRWLSDLNFDYGYPTFNFYYPGSYYLAQPFLFFGLDSITAYKIVVILTFILSGIFMFLWTRNYWGNFGGLASALLYLYAPYRFVSLYVNGTYGVSVAFAILPLVFWSFYLLSKKYTVGRLVFAALSLGLFLITHNTTILIFSPLIVTYLLYLILKSKTRRALFSRFLLSSIFGLSIAAFFLLPMIFELKYIRLRQAEVAADYQHHFPTLNQLFYSKWGYGYSLFGGIDEMAFQLGIAQWLVVLFLGILISCRKASQGTIRDRENSRSRLIFLFLANFLLILFLMLEQSNFIWQVLPILQRVQFPWKLLAVEVFITAFLAGSFTLLRRGPGLKPRDEYEKGAPRSPDEYRGRSGVSIKTLPYIFFVLLIALAFYGNRNHLRPATFDYSEEKHFLKDPFTADTSQELMPIWHKSFVRELKPRKLEVLEGRATVEAEKIDSTKYVYKVDIEDEASFLVHNLYFPGWQVFVDSQKVETKITKPDGLFSFQIPDKGKHQVEVVFKNTFVRNLGNALSLIGLIIVLFAKLPGS